MSKLRVQAFGLSADGYGVGPRQSLENPIGEGGQSIMQWFFATRTFHSLISGQDGGETGIDDDFAAAGFSNIGAWIIGRNMFGPHRGRWPENDPWQGWWGDTPPFHTPVFVLTQHPRPPVRMNGGTTFHFVTTGLHAALEHAKAAAATKDIRLGGGVATLRAYLQARLVHHLHLAISPTLLGAGEALFPGLDLPALGYRLANRVTTPAATHLVIDRADSH